MKIWLNSILACPDDHAYPLKLSIFKWDTEEDIFRLLQTAYTKKYLVNFKDEKDLKKIQVFNDAIFSKDENSIIADSDRVFDENKRLTRDIDFKNIISVFMEDDLLKIKDYNMVNPSNIVDYLDYYINFIQEMAIYEDKSENNISKDLLLKTLPGFKEKFILIRDGIKISKYENVGEKDEMELCDEVLNDLKDIWQDLLMMNYYFFVLEIEAGLLVCPTCKRWYPVIETIPRLFPKNMKRQDIDLSFKEQWNSKYPPNVV